MSLVESFEQMRAALEPLGIEIGAEVLAVWLDRQQHGREPLPKSALRDLIEWAEKVLAERQ